MTRGRQGNTESVDNYLKAILVLEQAALEQAWGGEVAVKGRAARPRVTVKALAVELKVAPASVTNMLQKLACAAGPMVEYERHGGVRLSKSGRRRALEVVRHHRLIETFLYEVLDYPIDELHQEAERLEHFISERFEERIAAKLGHPATDPHGHLIPAMDGRMAVRESMALAEVKRNGAFVVESVSDRDAGSLRRMEARGVVPGAKIDVKRCAGTQRFRIQVSHGGKAFDLNDASARLVRIVPPVADTKAKR